MPDGDDKIDTKQLQTTTYNQLLAYLFIKGVDPKTSGDLHIVLANSFALGTNLYPQDLASAASAVSTYKVYKPNPDTKSSRPKHPPQPEEEKKEDNNDSDDDPEEQPTEQLSHQAGFVQATDPTKIKCYRCQQFGHRASTCTALAPVAPPEGTHVQVGENFFCRNFPTDTNF